MDQIRRFIFDDCAVRGQWINLRQSWQNCLQNIDAEPRAQLLLGQAISAVSLLASTLKIDGNITLQIRGQGAVHLLVAQASDAQSVRGLVRQNSSIPDNAKTLKDIFSSDKMVITIDNGSGKPYQGIVPLTGTSIAEALEYYFLQSEQLPTRIWLQSNTTTSAGILLQQLPNQTDDHDAWNRLTQIAATVKAEEILELDSENLLFRLFHEDNPRLFEPKPVMFDCSCSINRITEIIQSIGEQEAQAILQEQGKIEVNCEFCNAQYLFDAVDIKEIFTTHRLTKDEPQLH